MNSQSPPPAAAPPSSSAPPAVQSSGPPPQANGPLPPQQPPQQQNQPPQQQAQQAQQAQPLRQQQQPQHTAAPLQQPVLQQPQHSAAQPQGQPSPQQQPQSLQQPLQPPLQQPLQQLQHSAAQQQQAQLQHSAAQQRQAQAQQQMQPQQKQQAVLQQQQQQHSAAVQQQQQLQLQQQMARQHQHQQQQLQLQQQAQHHQQQQQHQMQLHQQQAQQQVWNAWQQPPQQPYLFRTGSTDVEVPPQQQQQQQRGPQEAPDQQAAGGVSPEMHAQLQHLQQQAENHVMRSAKLAALGGLDYAPPAGLPTQLPPIRKTDVERLQQQLAHVQAQRQVLAANAQQLQMAMQQQMQQHASPALNGGAASSPHPLDSLRTFSGGVATAKKPPSGQMKRGRDGEGRERRAASVKAQEMRQEWLQQERQGIDQGGSPSPPSRTAPQGRSTRPQSAAAARAAAAREAEAAAAAAEAWEQAPDDKLRLKLKDIKAGLLNKWLQVYWPDDARWWPGKVADINVPKRRVVLLYETNEEEELDLADLVGKGEVAWLNREDAAPPPRPQPKLPRRGGSPPLPGLDDLTASGDLGLMDGGDIFGPMGGGLMMPLQHSAPYRHMPPQHMVQQMMQHGSGMDPHSVGGGGPGGLGSGGMPPGMGGPPSGNPGGGSGTSVGGPQGMVAILSAGQAAVGSLVHVYWAQQASWFAARVVNCSPPQRTVMVQYEGGRQDVLEAHKENIEYKIRLLPLQHRMAPPV